MNRLKLNKEIYNIFLINKVIQIFSELCDVKVIEDEKYFYCFFDHLQLDLELTLKEFENYLIGLMYKYDN